MITILRESDEWPTPDEIAAQSEQLLNDGSAKEMSNIIYDTLFNNTQFPQFDLNKSEDGEVDAGKGLIEFEYQGHIYRVTISLID